MTIGGLKKDISRKWLSPFTNLLDSHSQLAALVEQNEDTLVHLIALV